MTPLVPFPRLSRCSFGKGIGIAVRISSTGSPANDQAATNVLDMTISSHEHPAPDEAPNAATQQASGRLVEDSQLAPEQLVQTSVSLTADEESGKGERLHSAVADNDVMRGEAVLDAAGLLAALTGIKRPLHANEISALKTLTTTGILIISRSPVR